MLMSQISFNQIRILYQPLLHAEETLFLKATLIEGRKRSC